MNTCWDTSNKAFSSHNKSSHIHTFNCEIFSVKTLPELPENCLGRARCLQDNPLARTTENSQPLYCCGWMFTATLHSSGHGGARIENAVPLLLRGRGVYSGVARQHWRVCLPQRCAATHGAVRLGTARRKHYFPYCCVIVVFTDFHGLNTPQYNIRPFIRCSTLWVAHLYNHFDIFMGVCRCYCIMKLMLKIV
jgi:hypothetical protein